MISVIVTPNDCKKCHEKEVKEFNESQHHNARRLPTTGVGGYFLKNIADSQHLSYEATYATGTNGCYRCHGTTIKLDKKGYPTAETWPNSGIARENPDGSIGSCTNCHEKHEFSVAQARQPESCGVCHSSVGGDPQFEVYNSSRHGTTYHAKIDQMNLDSKQWIVGQDYFAAPTCATCHMSAINKATPATHNVSRRVGWNKLSRKTNSIAIEDKCGTLLEDTGYKQPPANLKHQKEMEQVCFACHSKGFVKNFIAQYNSELVLINEKWLDPGKKLFQLATDMFKAVEGKNKYQFYTHPIDFTWWGMCNTTAKSVHVGAGMVSGGWAQKGNGSFATSWYTGLIPQVESIIKNEEYRKKAPHEVKTLKNYFDINIKDNPVYFGPWGSSPKKGDNGQY